MRATVCKTFKFEAAHQLPNHDGKCRNLHGHSYRVEVEAEGPVRRSDGEPDEGMVLDFAVLKAAWLPLFQQLDHRCLNDVIDDCPTTAENLAGWLLSELRAVVQEVTAVRVWETAGAWAEVRA